MTTLGFVERPAGFGCTTTTSGFPRVCHGDGMAETLIYAVVCGAVAYVVASFVQKRRGGRPPSTRGLFVMVSVGLVLMVIALAIAFSG